MKEILACQKKFLKNFYDLDNRDSEYLESDTNELLMALVEEVIEARRCINWKRWKKQKFVVEVDKLKEELIDCFCFLNELFLLWNMDEEEIKKIYFKKMQINNERFIAKT